MRLRHMILGQPSLEYFTHSQVESIDVRAHRHKQGWFYLMCVAGRDSNCLDRKSSLCLSWCFCFSGRSTISGFSISSSSSPVGQRSKYSVIEPPADVH